MTKFIELSNYLDTPSVKSNSDLTDTDRMIRADQIVEIVLTTTKERVSAGLEYGKSGRTDGNVKASYIATLEIVLESGERVLAKRWEETDSAYKLKYARTRMQEEAEVIRAALIADINS